MKILEFEAIWPDNQEHHYTHLVLGKATIQEGWINKRITKDVLIGVVDNDWYRTDTGKKINPIRSGLRSHLTAHLIQRNFQYLVKRELTNEHVLTQVEQPTAAGAIPTSFTTRKPVYALVSLELGEIPGISKYPNAWNMFWAKFTTWFGRYKKLFNWSPTP